MSINKIRKGERNFRERDKMDERVHDVLAIILSSTTTTATAMIFIQKIRYKNIILGSAPNNVTKA